MQTPTHLLVNAALLTKRGEPKRNTAALIGAFVPDASIYVLFVWSKLAGIPEARVWREIYWQEPWQTLSAISNSVLLYAALLLAGVALRIRILWIFAASALLHLALDFPFHHSDAHKHFWPLTDWRFHSPLSYWNPAYYGNIVSKIEIGLAVICIAVLWRRFQSAWVRTCLGIALATYIAVPVYFRLALG